MSIQNKLDDLNNYFTTQICEGNFEIIELEYHSAKLRIKDGEDCFDFNIWYATSVDFVRIYEGQISVMSLSFTDDQKNIIYSLLQSQWEHHKRDILITKRQKIEDELIELDKKA